MFAMSTIKQGGFYECYPSTSLSRHLTLGDWIEAAAGDAEGNGIMSELSIIYGVHVTHRGGLHAHGADVVQRKIREAVESLGYVVAETAEACTIERV